MDASRERAPMAKCLTSPLMVAWENQGAVGQLSQLSERSVMPYSWCKISLCNFAKAKEKEMRNKRICAPITPNKAVTPF